MGGWEGAATIWQEGVEGDARGKFDHAGGDGDGDGEENKMG